MLLFMSITMFYYFFINTYSPGGISAYRITHLLDVPLLPLRPSI